ncbi:hypothetical protein MRB53_016457 [Persea americana]|uniref:Uncharacterized protein n=1 Tax=Persea americana TaxID=3435 RepID=A0ACC2M2S1_PERAE|nr:hypothetical protein MRB53_016457 [Persea americana]
METSDGSRERARAFCKSEGLRRPPPPLRQTPAPLPRPSSLVSSKTSLLPAVRLTCTPKPAFASTQATCLTKCPTGMSPLGMPSSPILFSTVGLEKLYNDEDERVFLTFLRAWEAGVEPTDFMVSSILSTCAGLAGLEFEKFVHKT